MRDGVVLTRTVPFASTAPLGTVSRLTCVNAQRMKSSIFVIFIPPQRKAPQAPIGHYRPGLLCHGCSGISCCSANSTYRFQVPCCHCTVSGLRAFRHGFRRFPSRVRRRSPAPILSERCVLGGSTKAFRRAAPYILQCSPCQMPTPGRMPASARLCCRPQKAC